ncbi:MAG: ATP-binding protein, partial [Candidatus Dactylopiibacterium sp.]|nr:ATP-binding protein [Candidatus Dactylopiibacterium sp.]
MTDPLAAGLPAYPFSALHGQPALRRALLLATVDPLIGGVLVEGPRGTAKSTAARALAALLPGGRFVNLPLSASEEQLVGTLDLAAALQAGEVRFRPGLLARAHEGVLYVDEVNLLADGLVDLLLDVSASGINRIERDGISHAHPARITLVGTMNPEEGELRPQLLDRFGLFVRLDATLPAPEREAIVRTRLAFDADPAGFVHRHAADEAALATRIAAARSRLPALAFDDALHAEVAARCHAAAVEGVRADLVMLRAARAHAALAGRASILADDLDAVSELVLAHRRHAPPPPAATQPARAPTPQTEPAPAATADEPD